MLSVCEMCEEYRVVRLSSISSTPHLKCMELEVFWISGFSSTFQLFVYTTCAILGVGRNSFVFPISVYT